MLFFEFLDDCLGILVDEIVDRGGPFIEVAFEESFKGSFKILQFLKNLWFNLFIFVIVFVIFKEIKIIDSSLEVELGAFLF